MTSGNQQLSEGGKISPEDYEEGKKALQEFWENYDKGGLWKILNDIHAYGAMTFLVDPTRAGSRLLMPKTSYELLKTANSMQVRQFFHINTLWNTHTSTAEFSAEEPVWGFKYIKMTSWDKDKAVTESGKIIRPISTKIKVPEIKGANMSFFEIDSAIEEKDTYPVKDLAKGKGVFKVNIPQRNEKGSTRIGLMKKFIKILDKKNYSLVMAYAYSGYLNLISLGRKPGVLSFYQSPMAFLIMLFFNGFDRIFYDFDPVTTIYMENPWKMVIDHFKGKSNVPIESDHLVQLSINIRNTVKESITYTGATLVDEYYSKLIPGKPIEACKKLALDWIFYNEIIAIGKMTTPEGAIESAKHVKPLMALSTYLISPTKIKSVEFPAEFVKSTCFLYVAKTVLNHSDKFQMGPLNMIEKAIDELLAAPNAFTYNHEKLVHNYVLYPLASNSKHSLEYKVNPDSRTKSFWRYMTNETQIDQSQIFFPELA